MSLSTFIDECGLEIGAVRLFFVSLFGEYLSMAVNRNSRILFLQDKHCPHHHPDTYHFLAALKDKYRPTWVIDVGDETDGHPISYHESDPDLMSAGQELGAAIEALKPIYRLFPQVDVMWSNHGSLIFRKGLSAGLPKDVFKPIGEILKAPKGWKWHEKLILTLPNGQKVFVRHDLGSNPIATSKALGMCVVGGHRHSQFLLHKWATEIDIKWAMVAGCMIDLRSRAFAYNKNQLLRPILGGSVIIDSQPKLEPMLLDRYGRWSGKLYG